MKNLELDDEFDFGFSSIGEGDFIERENKAVASAVEGVQSKVEQMYSLILPLLNNLAKDGDTNAYIHWPNRIDKIDQFKNKLLDIVNS
jgi:hypothetical protein